MEAKKFLIISIAVVVLVIAVLFAVLIIGKKQQAEQANTPDPVSVQCAQSCETNQRDGFCNFRIRVSDQIRTTCDDLSTNPQYASYDVATCPTISCVLTAEEADQTCVTGLNSIWATPTSGGTCPSQEGKFVRKRTPSDTAPTAGQICCFYYE